MMTNSEMDKIILKIKENDSITKQLEEETKAMKEQLKAELIERGVNELDTNLFTIRNKDVTSNRFDTKLFQAEHEDLYKMYLKESISSRFTIQ